MQIIYDFKVYVYIYLVRTNFTNAREIDCFLLVFISMSLIFIYFSRFLVNVVSKEISSSSPKADPKFLRIILKKKIIQANIPRY